MRDPVYNPQPHPEAEFQTLHAPLRPGFPLSSLPFPAHAAIDFAGFTEKRSASKVSVRSSLKCPRGETPLENPLKNLKTKKLKDHPVMLRKTLCP